jgi:predicted ATPase
VIDDTGKKTAITNLEEWGALWEDIYDDILVSESRRGEPTVPWEELKAEMTKEERERGNV